MPDFTEEQECMHLRTSYCSKKIVCKKTLSVDTVLTAQQLELLRQRSTVLQHGFTLGSHHCVEVAYRCRECFRTFRKTYEMRSDSGKRSRWGFYSGDNEEVRTSDRRVMYHDIEHCFEELGGNYDADNWDGRAFANSLWAELMNADETVACAIM